VPFRGSNLDDLNTQIMKGNFQYPVQISNEARDLIEKMLVVTPHHRIPIPQILRHKWLRNIDGLEDSTSEEDDERNFEVSLSFGRDECNFNPLFGVANQGNISARSNSMLMTEQSMNPMQQSGNINELNLENLFYGTEETQETE
jgi:serine/threonine protein kinase